MKHVKLFETFIGNNGEWLSGGAGMGQRPGSGGEEFNPGDMVIGIISEGTDVSVFPAEKARQVMSHLSAIDSNYYIPFFEKLRPGVKYVYIDADPSLDLSKETQHVLLTEDELSDLMKRKQITVFKQDGEEFGMNIVEGYAIELVGDDKYMSIQSWGQELEDGAFDHFMSIKSDEY